MNSGFACMGRSAQVIALDAVNAHIDKRAHIDLWQHEYQRLQL
jgi:hypothetical protein